ncbi:MAG: SprT family zinc-dependent metalloprotease [Candidatus Thiodiazotropha endolucinida]
MVPQSIWYGEERINFSVRYNHDLKRKITVSIDENGTVRVAAPRGTNLEDIRNAVRKRARWISTKVRGFKSQGEQLLPRSYVSGETHLYLGKQYLLKVLHDPKAKPGVKLIRGQLVATVRTKDKDEPRTRLLDWYRAHALDTFTRRVSELSKDVPWVSADKPPQVKLLAMKKQWGSCSPQGQLLLNPALVKAPRECIDYVLLHEICHLKEHNHSPRFYRLLNGLLPGWQNKKKMLDSKAPELLII